jgi:hypothetical protein
MPFRYLMRWKQEVQTTELATSTKSVITFLGEITPLDLRIGYARLDR